ncbi:hypothetical protein VL806_10225 [Listeria seeligeri]|uniref:hypothetical protein n=1 Tax=Listeria seeligeri TaxID=1640 RepID=UPI001628FB9F|nr:hypothetical protein [Listeria seeligeri]MBC1886241.1 hypothetical protein [Listeria seeligeri]QPJ25610.1 hypothetical protein IMX23_08850 [Listeria seeligeri]
MAGEHVIKKFTVIIVIFIIAIAAVVFFFWQVDAEEQTPKVTKSELIESNKVWVENKAQIPLQDNIILSIPAANTDATIATNGDLIIDSTNTEILQELAASNSRYKGIKAYRLRIEAKKVSEYITNAKYRFPTTTVQEKLTNYEITSGERTVETENTPVKFATTTNPNEIAATLKTTYSSDDAEIAANIFNSKIPDEITITDDTKDLATAKNLTIYPKAFVYDFMLQKNTMLIFKDQEEAMITEPIGIEYIIK